ncbi:hypothetical protein ACEWY4_009510 [Coilia grayii]|uniref:Ribonuclease A-domain domain-containing protein n=1 Tax=Coilia grayii TaxID=363190 RepID=A0ABD1K6M3_9TELE
MKMQLLPCVVVVLLWVFSTAQCSSSNLETRLQPSDYNERYKTFRRQHVIGKMAAKDCDKVIKKRKIKNSETAKCKEVNTFVIASIKEVCEVCQTMGKPYHKNKTYIESVKTFQLVVCKLKSKGKRLPKCAYRGQECNQHIVLSCEKGLPVHFQRSFSLNVTIGGSLNTTLGGHDAMLC